MKNYSQNEVYVPDYYKYSHKKSNKYLALFDKILQQLFPMNDNEKGF